MPPAILRYPGSKAKLAAQIIATVPDAFHVARCQGGHAVEYREPFFGSGALGLEVVSRLPNGTRVWINDLDPGVYAIWLSVMHDVQPLERAIAAFQPTVDAFQRLKADDGVATGDTVRDALHKIALHRMSVSGFGAMSGGPMGGVDQRGPCTVGSRWNPATIITAVRRAHRIVWRFRDRLRITNLHFRDVIASAGAGTLIYLDPPYYARGSQLYSHHMSDPEHAELAAMLRGTDAEWRLSYDDCDRVRELYSWAASRALAVRYTNAVTSGSRPQRAELLICPAPRQGSASGAASRATRRTPVRSGPAS
jgi:DNA adenine methylase